MSSSPQQRVSHVVAISLPLLASPPLLRLASGADIGTTRALKTPVRTINLTTSRILLTLSIAKNGAVIRYGSNCPLGWA